MKKIVWIIAVFLLLVSGGVSYAVDVNIALGLVEAELHAQAVRPQQLETIPILIAGLMDG